MKTRGIILILAVLLFSSCIVKSLQPFYTTDSLSFNEKLLGSWTDNKKGQWTVESIKDKIEQDRKEGIKLSEEEEIAYKAYKEGYFITYIRKEKEAGFIAMPFKIDEHYFLDFIPIDFDDNEINSLAAKHLLKTHSVAKLDIDSNKAIKLSWLSEERINDLFEQNKIRLKHERIGFQKDLLLTASSEELYEFMKKFMNTDIENKWKKEDMLTLARTDAKP